MNVLFLREADALRALQAPLCGASDSRTAFKIRDRAAFQNLELISFLGKLIWVFFTKDRCAAVPWCPCVGCWSFDVPGPVDSDAFVPFPFRNLTWVWTEARVRMLTSVSSCPWSPHEDSCRHLLFCCL